LSLFLTANGFVFLCLKLLITFERMGDFREERYESRGPSLHFLFHTIGNANMMSLLAAEVESPFISCGIMS
jgi:hypothetical protein